MNALVVPFFVRLYLGRLAVMFSPGGLVSKAAQILLELSLFGLIVVDWRLPTTKYAIWHASARC